MRRIIMLVTVALLMTAMLVASAMPAFAQGEGPSACQEQEPGQFISGVAQDPGHSSTNNPGNAMNEVPPFVPFVTFSGHVACNPTAT